MVHIVRTLHVFILGSILCSYNIVHVHRMYVCTVVNYVYTLRNACMYPQCLSAPQNGPASVHTSSFEGEESQHQLIVRQEVGSASGCKQCAYTMRTYSIDIL